MSNDSKKTSQLTITTTLSANDRVVVLTNPGASAQTQTIALSDFGVGLIPGPFTSDTTAGANSVNVGGVYYRTDGTVRIRLT
jgi:hypothetical protein